MPNNVNHPAHYNQGEMETIEAIEGQGWGPGFCCGSVTKYLARYGTKDGSEDLQKAEWYVRRLLRKQLVMDGGATDARNTMLLLAIDIASEELPGVRAELTELLASRNQPRKAATKVTRTGEESPAANQADGMPPLCNESIEASQIGLDACLHATTVLANVDSKHLAPELKEFNRAAWRALSAFGRSGAERREKIDKGVAEDLAAAGIPNVCWDNEAYRLGFEACNHAISKLRNTPDENLSSELRAFRTAAIKAWGALANAHG